MRILKRNENTESVRDSLFGIVCQDKTWLQVEEYNCNVLYIIGNTQSVNRMDGKGAGTMDQGQWIRDMGSVTRDQGHNIKDMGPGTWDPGQGIRGKGSGTWDQGSGTRDQGYPTKITLFRSLFRTYILSKNAQGKPCQLDQFLHSSFFHQHIL